MIRSTFSGFTMAQLALQYNQKGLDVAGQNSTNAKTKGYTRQRLDNMSLNLNGLSNFYSTGANPNIGYGVEITGISQLRDKFLDIQYRDQTSKLSSTESINKIQDLLGDVWDETDKDAIHTQLTKLSSALANYSTHVGDREQESVVKSEMQSTINLLYRAHVDTQKIRSDLEPSEDGQSSMSIDLQKTNNLIRNIADISKQITMSKILGNPALELKDQRNLMLDELSKFLPISVKYTDKITSTEPEDRSASMDYITITLNDNDSDPTNDIVLLKESQFDIKYKEENGKMILDKKGDKSLNDTIYFRQVGAQVMKAGSKNAANEDISGKTEFFITGVTKAGDPSNPVINEGIFTTKSKDIPHVFNTEKTPDASLYDVSGIERGYNDTKTILGGQFKGQLDMLNKDGAFNNTDVDGIGYFNKSIDLMVDNFAKTLNALNTPEPLPQGKTKNDYTLLVAEFSKGEIAPKDITTTDKVILKKGDVIEKGSIVLPSPLNIGNTDYEKNVEVPNDNVTLDKDIELPAGTIIKQGKKIPADVTTADGPFTAYNIRISDGWRVGKVSLTASKDENAGSQQNENILTMMRALTEKRDFNFKTLGNNNIESVVKGGVPFFNGNYGEFYTNISVTLGVDKSGTDMLVKTQKQVESQISYSRDQVSGVDQNEEVIAMMQYNKAYSAASRLMTTMDQMLETLMNTGRVGR